MKRRHPVRDLLVGFDAGVDGPWTRRAATHLLSRAQFGASEQEISAAAEAGLEKTLDRLITPQPEAAEFRSTSDLLRQVAADSGRIQDLKAWWLYRMLYSSNPLLEKTCLLWHSHFATSNAKVQSVEHMGSQNDLIRRYALGDFRKLLDGMTRDVAMLIWLDGNANQKRSPNENFAREVMELFTLGVDNYSEQDIQEAARAFTGWHVRNDKFWFNRAQHDQGTKRVLGRAGDLDGSDVVDACLEQASCPRFLASKLLSFFVTPSPEVVLVNAVADRIREHDFVMRPVLREILGARFFYRSHVRHSIIKSPLDFVLGAHRSLDSRANLQETARLLSDLGQDLFEPPTVKGWDGGRLWITSASMLRRSGFAAELAYGRRFGTIALPATQLEALDLAGENGIVDHYLELMLARDVSPSIRNRLTGYVKQSGGKIEQRIRGTIHLVMTLPEYQLV